MYYDPTDAKKNGKKIPFGRGYDGQEAAERWQQNRLLSILKEHNFAVPEKIDNPTKNYRERFDRSYDSVLACGWMHPVFGAITVALKIDRHSNPKQSQFLWALDGHPLIQWLTHQQISNIDERQPVVGVNTVLVINDQHMPKKFRANPFWNLPAYAALLNPPAELNNQPYPTGILARHSNPLWSYQKGSADLWADEEKIKGAIVEGLPLIERAIKAFEFLGIKVSTEYRGVADEYGKHSWSEDKQVLHELTIEIPQLRAFDPETPDALTEYHRIKISPNGISVNCGFVNNKTEYERYQRREMTKFLTENQEYEDTSFKIERAEQGEE